MNVDIRLSTGFWQHPKVKKLIRRAGLEGVRSLQILWLWTAQNRPDGNLQGCDAESLELAADWTGDSGAFARALSELAFLDGEEGSWKLHGWVARNGWAAADRDRSDRGRFNKMKKIYPAEWKLLSSAGVHRISKEDYERMRNAEERPAVAARLAAEAAAGKPEGGDGGGQEARQAAPEAPVSAPKPKPAAASGALPFAEGFERFWTVFDFKSGRAAAEKAWREIPGLNGALVERICEAAGREASVRKGLAAMGRMPKWAGGWLSGRRWDDDYGQLEELAATGRKAAPAAGRLEGRALTEANRANVLAGVEKFLASEGEALPAGIAEEDADEPEA